MPRNNGFYRIQTDQVIVPDHLQHDTGCPGDPQGDIRTGYAMTQAELKATSKLDRTQGGKPTIDRVRWDCREEIVAV